jgi:hypothetical protein|tara:strand:- start:9848 stop:10663 length:816 start_codon:yes stop_codon:yes gene_type:complete
MTENPKFLKVKERALKARKAYQESASQYSNFLIYGDFGTGKTQLISTCPKPIFIDSFDPGGTKTAALQPGIDNGDIIVDNRWEGDSWKDPYAFAEWEKEMQDRQREGLFEHIGTYALDSLTKWSDSLMYEILRRGSGGKTRKGSNPQLQDYLVQQLTAVDWLGVLMGHPCHVVATGHIGLMKDDVSGKMETGLLMYGKLSEKVPLVFDEKYVTRVKSSSSGVSYELLTRNDGYYKAETRMGGGKFEHSETPDIRALLKKAGRPVEDRPYLH